MIKVTPVLSLFIHVRLIRYRLQSASPVSQLRVNCKRIGIVLIQPELKKSYSASSTSAERLIEPVSKCLRFTCILLPTSAS